MAREFKKWLVVVLLFLCAISLNIVVFLSAFPQISSLVLTCCNNGAFVPKDFSAYYIGAWRLIHDPNLVYTHAFVNDGEASILPSPNQFKYLPSFLVFVFPLLTLDYPNALFVFDLAQFALLPVMAFLIYKLLCDKGMLATGAIGFVALLLPAPYVGWSVSVPYFWQWSQGQAKVLDAFLLLLCLYYAKSSKPALSGIFLALSFFDPRFSIAALPLFIMYNNRHFKRAFATLAVTLIGANATLLYPPLGSGFVQMVFSTGLRSGFYPYALIPLFPIVAISCVNYKEIYRALAKLVANRRLKVPMVLR